MLELIFKNIFQIGVQFEAILIYPGNFNDNSDSVECDNYNEVSFLKCLTNITNIEMT